MFQTSSDERRIFGPDPRRVGVDPECEPSGSTATNRWFKFIPSDGREEARVRAHQPLEPRYSAGRDKIRATGGTCHMHAWGTFTRMEHICMSPSRRCSHTSVDVHRQPEAQAVHTHWHVTTQHAAGASGGPGGQGGRGCQPRPVLRKQPLCSKC